MFTVGDIWAASSLKLSSICKLSEVVQICIFSRVRLFQDDRSLINLHLMHTSYFLFVMVITMFCYAVIKGRPGKVRSTNPDFCPEKVHESPAELGDLRR